MKNLSSILILFFILFTQLSFAQIVLPWTEDFEGAVSYTYDSDSDTIYGLYDWNFDNTSDGRLRTHWVSVAPHSGSNMATLDVINLGLVDVASLIVKLDLSLYANSDDLNLSFYYMPHGGNSDTEDCISVVCGESSEYAIYDLYNIENPAINGEWNHVSIDLDSALNSHALFAHEDIYLKFNVKSEYAALTSDINDGISFDDISITGTMPQVLLPWIEGFEGIKDEMTLSANQTNINGRGYLSYEKTLNGRLRFNAGLDFYHSGSRAATLDCDSYNSFLPENMLILTLNMSRYSNYDDLELSFYYMHHNRDSDHSTDVVYIRGASSDPWIEACDLMASPAPRGDWKEIKDIDIDALILGAGQSITSSFQIAFSQKDENAAITNRKESGITVDDITITTNDRYWVGAENANFADANNWYPILSNYSSEEIIPDRTIILDSTLYSPQSFSYPNDTTYIFKDLIVEENAYLSIYTGMGEIIDFEFNGDINNNGMLDLASIPSYSSITVYGDINNNGDLSCGDNLGYFFLHGDFINNTDCEGNSIASLTLSGNTTQNIGGTETTVFQHLFIDNSLDGVENAVELTATTNELLIWHLEIWDGSFEINSGANVSIGNLRISEDAGLNLDDGNIVCTFKGNFANFNTSCSSTHGLVTSMTTEIVLDATLISSDFIAPSYDFDEPFLMFGYDTDQGSEIYNLTIEKFLPSSDVYYNLYSDLVVKNSLNLKDGVIMVMDESFDFESFETFSNKYPKITVENTALNAIMYQTEESFISGPLRRYVIIGSYSFPVGYYDGGSSFVYQLASVDINSTSGGLSYLDVSFTHTSSQTPPEGLEVFGSEITEFLDQGFWTVSPDIGSADYDITLTSRGHTNGGYVPEQHAIFKRSGLGDWESLGTHDNATQTGSESDPITATRSSLTGFSDFIIGKNGLPFPLPVELLSFTANCNSDYTVLNWETASELNNDYFTIEKSRDGVNFVEIAEIIACGTCNYLSDYEYIDYSNNEQKSYYRLKQTDYDGKFEYSDIITTDCGSYLESLSYYVNDNMLILNAAGIDFGAYFMQVFDAAGKLVFENNLIIDANQEYSIDISSISSGIYLIRLYNDNNIHTDKIYIGE